MREWAQTIIILILLWKEIFRSTREKAEREYVNEERENAIYYVDGVKNGK